MKGVGDLGQGMTLARSFEDGSDPDRMLLNQRELGAVGEKVSAIVDRSWST